MPHDWSFEPVVLGAILAAVIALGMSLVMGCLIVAFRVWRRSVERRNKRLVNEWEPLLFVAMDGPVSVGIRPIGTRDLTLFLELWTHLQEATRGQASIHLNAFLQNNIPAHRILHLAQKGDIRSRLVAVTALGHMKCRDAVPLLLSLVNEANPVLSYAALRALLRIDPTELLATLVPILLSRSDWPISRLSAIFRELGATTITPSLLASLGGISDSAAMRLLPLLALCHREQVDALIRPWLADRSDPEVISAGLEFLRSPDDIPVLVEAAKHEDWRVRAAAASGIGEIGADSELPILVQLLSDKSWWVRYRAAKALVAIFGSTSTVLNQLSSQSNDKFARDILQQARAEAT